jgi:hypothetical protein
LTLLLSPEALNARRELVQRVPDALGGLATSLQRELHAARSVPVPNGKARLTRYGGRCPKCTVLLNFDPREPYAHACPSCGAVQTDVVHHEWWLMNAHLWTAEQCTRAAVLTSLLDDPLAAARADEILNTYAEWYATWPNRDNVLGPTRPFFSTYLESIWLLHLAIACDLRERTTSQTLTHVRRALIAPSAELIAGYDEGRSNRQVWNTAALLAASRLLGDNAGYDAANRSLVALMQHGLHDDGSWYEGENYHLFAHRGLLTAVTLAEQGGAHLPPALLSRFHAGFATPFRTMLPDGTFPARRDSQYGVALRQYRTAEWLECGLARTDTAAIRAALAMMYAEVQPGDTGRARSTADAERNGKGVRLTRADLNWRALLLAPETLPPLDGSTLESVLLEGQGLAVFRRGGGTFWVGLDYGDTGAGHGHPDRLNLLISTRTDRWLDDVGTGSYTSPTLDWYRSTLAHNAPLVNGRDQGAAAGVLLAHDERGEVGWVSAKFTDPRSQVTFQRTVIICPDHVLDELTWNATHDVTVDLPLQVRPVHLPTQVWQAFSPHTEMDTWLRDPQMRWLNAGDSWHTAAATLPSPAAQERTGGMCNVVMRSDEVAQVWTAGTIVPPGGDAHALLALRQRGRSGRSVRVFTAGGVRDQRPVLDHLRQRGSDIAVDGPDGYRYLHRREPDGWRVTVAERTVRLGGVRLELPIPAPMSVDDSSLAAGHAAAGAPIVVGTHERWSRRLTGADAWRPTEESWHAAGEPEAEVTVVWQAGEIHITVDVTLHRAPHFASALAENPLDNEHPDVNSDGVQLHWRSSEAGDWNSMLLVPEPTGVRCGVISGTADELRATWSPTAAGYRMDLTLPWPDPGVAFVMDLCVNECPPDRERRRGQLVLSGARGEFGYLRGGRQSDQHAIRLAFSPVVT